ncbi:MAG: biotin--[acetyl-CoA-carboxylase] ligase [Phycisphaerales bacterium]
MNKPADAGAIEVFRLESVDSTNMHARRELERGSPPAGPRVYIAREQTLGRGQRGRTWASPPGGLWCTFVMPRGGAIAPDELSGKAAGTLGIRVGLACVSTVHAILRQDRASVTVSLKLPNDVLVHSRKIAGILTEVVTTGAGDPGRVYVLVGVGINADVALTELPPAIQPQATTLRTVLGRAVDVALLERTLIQMMAPAISAGPLTAPELIAVRACLHGRGSSKRVVTPGGLLVEGKLEGVDALGAVVVSTPTGTASGTLEPSLR